MSHLISLHIPQSHKSWPLSAPIFQSMWLMDLETVISFFDKMHFIFSCVISNQCLWVLISVPRSLLLLTWETDTFLNAYNCPGELTWPSDLSCRHTGFQWGGGSFIIQRYYNVFNINLFQFGVFYMKALKRSPKITSVWRRVVKSLCHFPPQIFNGFFPLSSKRHTVSCENILFNKIKIFHHFEQTCVININRAKQLKNTQLRFQWIHLYCRTKCEMNHRT